MRLRLVLPFGLVCAAALLAARSAAAPKAVDRRPPNFVFILGEGNGWSNTSVQMDDRLPGSRGAYSWTPNLERLAREGMRFSDFYAASPRCTPSRAAFFTGVSPARLHMTYINESGREDGGGPRRRPAPNAPVGPARLLAPEPVIELPTGTQTIGDVLKAEGYATAHFGKWHVGRVSPARHGFDETDGANGNEGPDRRGAPNPKEAYALTERGLDFLTRRAADARPFYLQLSHYPGRSIEEATPETRKELAERFGNRPGRDGEQPAIIADMDKTIGLVLQKLDALGLAERTYVIYSADHGTQGRNGNAPLAGGKGSVREGGVRVPFIIRGPGIKPGTCSHVRAGGWDLLPTLADLAGSRQPLPPNVEGGSFGRILTSGGVGTVRRPRAELVIHFPHYDLNNGGPASALYLDQYKLVRSFETGTSSLFDLSRDLGEQRDLATEMPDRAANMDRLLTAYLKAVNAQVPRPNPQTSPRGEGPSSKTP